MSEVVIPDEASEQVADISADVEPSKPDPIEPEQPRIPMFKVFVATMPDQFGRSSCCLSEVAKIDNILTLHPCYDFESDIGKRALSIIGVAAPKCDVVWESVLRKDYFCIEKSDVVVFDSDANNRGLDLNHFLAVAACYHKPVIVVSPTLESVPAYFSGSSICVVKPEQLEWVLRKAFEDRSFLRLPTVQ